MANKKPSPPPIKQKYIRTPEALWKLWLGYVNSLEVLEIQQPHVKLGIVTLKVTEPMTMEGFKCFGYENGLTLEHYIRNSDNSYEAYCQIVTRIKEQIYKNNFSRASVGIFKEALIAKQLGLKEKIENTNIEQPLFTDVPTNNSNK